MNLLKPSLLKRMLFFILADILLFYISLLLSYSLRFDFDIPPDHISTFYTLFVLLSILKIGSFYLFGIYHLTWRFFGLDDAKRLFFAHITAFIAFFVIFTIQPDYFIPMPRSVIGIDLVLSLILVGMLRLSKRILIEHSALKTYKPTLIIGISPNTANLIKSTLRAESGYYPLGIIAVQEKNRTMIGSTIQNITVSDLDRLPSLVASKKITAAIIDGALPSEYLRETYQLLSDSGIREVKRTRLLDNTHNRIEELSVEDLLARHPKDLDTSAIATFVHNKTVLITGAGGSIGSELSLQCRRFGAKKLLLLDHSEYNLYQIGEKLPEASLHLCNIINREALDTLFQSEPIDLVIHAAAYKHVPLCESNIHAAILNNIIGSKNVIDCAIANDVSKVVIISTDKAVRPTNVMGATKRVVELYAQNVDPHNSEIVSVRFGNVLGSSGSVIPKFKAQIETGGPVTITHPEVTRYFMLISEACQLVLQAAAIAQGGELFILDMGKPVKIIDLARTMIRLYATEPVEIVTTKLRPGEKLYEELLIDESEQKTTYESIMIARSTHYDIHTLNQEIELLLHSSDPRPLLRHIVPEFTDQL